MRNAADPNRSGAQTRRLVVCGEPVLHRPERADVEQQACPRTGPPRSTRTDRTPTAPRLRVASRSSRPAARVKKIGAREEDNTVGPGPTSCTKPGNGPMKKQADPTAKPAAIKRSQPPCRTAGGQRPVNDRSRPRPHHSGRLRFQIKSRMTDSRPIAMMAVKVSGSLRSVSTAKNASTTAVTVIAASTIAALAPMSCRRR